MAEVNRLSVLLQDAPVGELILTRSDGCEFRLLDSYKEAFPRPVLGQKFLDDLDTVHASRARTPPWFSNLLPEGPLRELIAKRAGVSVYREFFLLHHLGDDLPGAVRIVAEDVLVREELFSDMPNDKPDADNEWHFSLAGVQLKFSALREGRGLTVPVSGRGGDWIVKLPDARFPKVPENEHATMLWAKASGIDIPAISLVPVSDIAGLPEEVRSLGNDNALAVSRFDRAPSNHRIHIEDFAQVLGLYPDEKYDKFNYETLASLIMNLAGDRGLDEFIRRLVFVIASGNGDAHHKNWSLIYRDGVNADLSPAYDLVSIVQYKEDDRLALNLARSKRWEDVSLNSFLRLARKIGADEMKMSVQVTASVDQVMSAWQRSSGDFGYDAGARDLMMRHFRRIPLFGSWV